MKKAFTLVELLGVIIILGVLALITFPIIDKSIKNSKEKALERAIDNIEEAAYNYSITNDIGYETFYKKLSLEELKKSGFLEKETINPVTNENMTGCVIYKWDDSKKQYEFKYEDPCPSYPEIPTSLISILLEQYSKGNTKGLLKDSTNPNLYYYTGTNEQVANNFLWYGGHQWRVLEFNTEEKTLTLITQQPLTAIQPASTAWTTKELYESSYINTWLNDYFWNSLDSSIQSNILDSTFNVGIYNNVDEITTTQKVGLLDEDQYIRAGSEKSFLSLSTTFLLGNRSNMFSSIRVVLNYGGVDNVGILSAGSIRAVIKIFDINIIDGDGTLESSYRTEKKAINTNNVQVGEYINVPYSGDDNACGSDNMCTFRVVSKYNDSIKVILNGLLPSKSMWADSANDNITTNDLIYTPLKEFIGNIGEKYITTGTYGIGMYTEKNSYTVPQNTTITASIGLPTIGEMFSGNDIDLSTSSTKIFVDVNTIENPTISNYYWTMNRYSSSYTSYIYCIEKYGYAAKYSPSDSGGVRAIIYLKAGNSAITFTGGEGTPNSPYTLQ